MNRVFGIFLDKLSKHFNKYIYQDFCILIVYYRKTLNKIGWDLKEETSFMELLNEQDGKDEYEYCEVNNAQFASEAVNCFILRDYPRMLAEMKSSYEFHYLSASE